MASKRLVLTGLSEEVARFQAKSALTGTGFTTKEALEKIVEVRKEEKINEDDTLENREED